MEIVGKLVKKLEQEAGESKAGKPYVKQICLVETDAKYNPFVAIQCFGEDKIKQMNKLEVGMIVSISCNVYSREYKGKYYHNIDGYWFTNQSENPEINKAVAEELNGRSDMDRQDQKFVTIDDEPLPF
jgi:hypothetical protein